MSEYWSRRRLVRFGGLAALAGLSGASFSTLVGTIGFRLRNYTTEAYEARVEIDLFGRTAFEQTYRLPSSSDAEPHVRVETNAVSKVPSGASYTASLSLDGTTVRTVTATMDCTNRTNQQIDEELDISIGFDGGDEVEIGESQC